MLMPMHSSAHSELGNSLPKGANDCKTFLIEKILPEKQTEIEV